MTALTIGLEKVDLLPPTRVTDDTSVLTLKNLVFEPLVAWRAGRAVPALFAGWTHSAGGRVWRFDIRAGAVFHDGTPCVAQHVLDFIDAIMGSVDTFGMKWAYSRYLANARLYAEGDRVVVVENPTPFADVLDVFAEFFLCRLDTRGRPTLGTGRYRVVTFEPGVGVELAAVSGGGVERITVHQIPDADERRRRVLDGSLDAALNLERIDGTLTFDERADWTHAVNTMSVMAYLDGSKGLFATAQARLAANLAIDTDRLAREVFHGYAVPSATVVSPHHLGSTAAGLAPIPYAPDRARELLDDTGGPSRIRLRTPTFMPERAPEIAEFVAQSLEAVGVGVDVEVQTDRPEYAREIGRKEMGDIAIFDSSPQSTFRVLDDKLDSRTRGIWWQGVTDETLDTLIDAAHSAVTDDDRELAYGRCLSRLHTRPAWLYLVHPVVVAATRPGLPGVAVDAKGVLAIS
ncbi:MAG: ABC transporter substrate-binding protein [Gordonia sp. (in: high G+C Gram-positive bacteria)]